MNISAALLALRHGFPAKLCAVALLLGLAQGAGAQALWAQGQSPAPTEAERTAVETIVREYLLAHPEVIVEALQSMQERERLAAEARQREGLQALRAELETSDTSPVMGNPEGDVTIVEFFDYRCPYCQRAAGMLSDVLGADDRIRLVLKEWPILGPDSLVASRAALAADLQGKYEALHQAIFAYNGDLTETTILALAKSIGLDTERLQKDMNDPRVTAEIERNQELARKLAIRGTPAFIVGETIVPGAVSPEELRALVAQTREARG